MTESSSGKALGKRSPEEARRLASRGYARLSTTLLYILGAYILLAPWIAPDWLGWTLITNAVGGEQVFLRIAVGLLFLYFATLTQEKYALKFLTQNILHAFNIYLYGPDYRQHRESVAAQIGLLASPNDAARGAAHRALKQMTGQKFPAEHEPWAAWWKQARHTFRLAKGARPAGAAGEAAASEIGENKD